MNLNFRQKLKQTEQFLRNFRKVPRVSRLALAICGRNWEY